MSSDPNETTAIDVPEPTQAEGPRDATTEIRLPSTMFDDDPLATSVLPPAGSPPTTIPWPDTLAGGESVPSAVRASLDGSDFGNYVLLAEVGRGGMGVVYKARQKGLDRLVAIKMILSNHRAGAEHVVRFHAEARAAAKLNDPHVVAIHDVGEIDGQHYFAMEFVDGPSLAELIREKAIGFVEAARLAATVARAVGRLHDRGIIHRDLKPSNILLDSFRRPYVTDFGLVKLMEDSSGTTHSGTILGTPSYMAPEQAAGGPGSVGPKSDIYSLGAVLYELLTGRPPFNESSPMETLTQVLGRDPTPPTSIEPTVPPALELICLKCLEKTPGDRYESAAALADDLDRYLRGDDVAAHPAGWSLRVRRWARREPALASRLGGLSLCMTVTEIDYLLVRSGSLSVHTAIMGLLGLWLFASWLFQKWLRKGRHDNAIHLIWSMTDLAMLTALLIVDNAMLGPLISGYPLLIAASGLWFRVPLVWATTVMAEVFYTVLVLVAYAREGSIPNPSRHFMSMATLGVLGVVIVTLVKRIHILSQHVEQGTAS